MSQHRSTADKYTAFRTASNPFSLFVAMDPVYKVPPNPSTLQQNSTSPHSSPSDSRLHSYGVIGPVNNASHLHSYASVLTEKGGKTSPPIMAPIPLHFSPFTEWVGVEKKYEEAKENLEVERQTSRNLLLKYQEAQRQLEKITKEYSQLYAWSQSLSNVRSSARKIDLHTDDYPSAHDRSSPHDRPSYRQKKYFRCYVCHRSFYSQVELDEHCLGDGHFCCRTCTQRSGGKHCLFPDRQELVKHLKTTHPPYE